MSGPTERQALILRHIKRSIDERGYPPTYRELRAALGIRSTNAVQYQILALEKKGYIERGPHHHPRSLRLTVLGGGRPTDAAVAKDAATINVVEKRIGNVVERIDSSLAAKADYLFRMNSDALIDRGIRSGDLLLVDRHRVHAGELVMVELAAGLTARYFHPATGGTRFVAANSRVPTVEMDAARASRVIVGRVTGIYRPLDAPADAGQAPK